MAQAQRYRLKLSRLDFVSLVDDPAQPNAKTLLIKRKGAEVEGETHAKFVKANDELGVAFFWAFTSTNPDGSDHYDLHGDAIDKSNLVKIAMDFMVDGGGAVDEMHDGVTTDARCVAFPMDPDIAKAFGVVTKTSGLMVMIKLNDEQLEKLKDGTYTGVSIAGLGTREAVKSKVAKSTLYTDEQAGHQHTVCFGEGGDVWTSWATATGAENGHSHAVTYENGVLVILADSGHSHVLAEGQPALIVVPQDAVVVVANANTVGGQSSTGIFTRGAGPGQVNAPKSTPSTAIPIVNTITRANQMKTAEEKLADLEKSHSDTTKRLERAERIAKMTGAEKAFFDDLPANEKDAFLEKSNADRAAAMTADAVEFTFDGIEYRKSTQGYALAKRLRDEVAKNERAEIEKQVGQTCPHLAGDGDTKIALLKAIRCSGESAEMQAKMLGVLKGADAFAKGRTVAAGSDAADASVEKSATEQLEALTLEYAKANKVERSAARVAVMKTADGKRLYAESIGRS